MKFWNVTDIMYKVGMKFKVMFHSKTASSSLPKTEKNFLNGAGKIRVGS